MAIEFTTERRLRFEAPCASCKNYRFCTFATVKGPKGFVQRVWCQECIDAAHEAIKIVNEVMG